MTVEHHKRELEEGGLKPVKERLDDLQNVAERLVGCLKERETGLMSWWEMTFDLMREMKAHLDFAGVK